MSFSSFINRLSIVKQIPIFSKLNWFEQQKIARKAVLVEYKKGEVIFRQGDPADGIYCLVSGRLLAYLRTPEGKQDNVEYIHRGKHFGIISLFTGDSHSLTFEAINDSLLLKISREDFEQILKTIPQLGIEFSHSLSRRLHRRTNRTKSIFESTVISIYSPTKGSGSSTYAINLALSLERETNKKVLFLNINSKDMEVVSTIPETAEAAPQWKQSAVDLSEVIGDDEKIAASIAKNQIKVDLLNVVFDRNDVTLIKEISSFVSSLANDYHYVVVDLPNDMDDVVLTTLTQSDLIQLVTLDGKEELKLTKHVIKALKSQLKESFKTEKLQVLMSGIEAKCYLSFEEINKQLDFDVYAKLSHIDPSNLSVAVVSDTVTIITSDPESEYAKAVTRIARQIGGVLVGLVLGGGAALGVAHIGVIRVLEQENIPIDIVVGSSMGALISSFWATGLNAAQLEERARDFEKAVNMWQLADPVAPIWGFVGGRAIKRWLRKTLGNKTFYSTEIPLKIVAYDLNRREELVINSGSLVDAVRKSIAIPGVINPVLEDDRMIIDGGVLNPLPTNVMASLGIKKIIAVNVLQSPEQVSNGYDMLLKRRKEMRSVKFLKNPWKFSKVRFVNIFKKMGTRIPDIIIQSLQASEYLLAEQSAQQADVLIHPDLTGINWFELYRVDDLIECGEIAARQALPAIKELISESKK